MSTAYITNEQAIAHRDHACVEKCIHVMHRIITKAIDDQDAIYQAKLGILRELRVGDKEATQESGRKKFLLNALSKATSLSEEARFRIHVLAEFRCFCFHAHHLGVADCLSLVNETMPTDEKFLEAA
ncbi:hypothetical protein [Salinivibrio kushneri]|uniref:hypothetical protein n=1 Tax=Salinivibrio kushneri TaxID=1908198 RepID=UPI0009898D27|nr:hypothetical protein [Salinivibrio kushneri]OOE71728.1 hypothetical protein BZG19_02110 [Salinivibrio kushneri]